MVGFAPLRPAEFVILNIQQKLDPGLRERHGPSLILKKHQERGALKMAKHSSFSKKPIRLFLISLH
jgi:hypothetical protein